MKKRGDSVRFGDVCELIKGRKPALRDHQRKGDRPYLIARVLRGEPPLQFASPSDRNATCVEADETIIICDGSNSGETFTGFSGILSSTMAKLRITRPDVDSGYLRMFLLMVMDDLKAGRVGAAIPHLDRDGLYQMPIALPPLPEQRRIVAILDEAFGGITTATANGTCNKVAITELFQSQSLKEFEQLGREHSWVTLEQLLEEGWIQGHLDGNHGSDYPRKEEFVSSGVPYISANCLDGNEVDMSRCKYLSPARAAKLRKGIARNRDVLFAHNATVGPVAILKTSEPQVILGTSLTYYRCDESRLLPEYLSLFMQSAGFVRQYEQVMRQSTRNQVPITKQREFRHIVPSVDAQRQIIGRLGGLSQLAKHSADLYHRRLAALDELKASLLHQAFTGQL